MERSLLGVRFLVLAATLVSFVSAGSTAQNMEDPLPSWNHGGAKSAIVSFVERVTDESSPDFVPQEERIATFDNDGTLWGEQPIYVQLAFVVDRVKVLAPDHPEWSSQEPFKSILLGDLKGAMGDGHEAILEIIAATHSGMTTLAFEAIVSEWIATARHPKTRRLYTEMVYAPQLELLTYLRANGFATYIVSGGGVEFMRPWTERVYGIPPEQVIGSSVLTKFAIVDGKPVLQKQPKIGSIDDGPGKPENINLHIGRRPILAFGNSDGDLQMLEWTAAGEGASLALLVHHDDATREFAYDRNSSIGKLDKAWDAAVSNGWIVVSMKDDWRLIYP